MRDAIDAAEAAEILGLKRSTIYKKAANGEIPSVKYDSPSKNPKRRSRGAVRFNRSDILAFMKSHRREAL